MVERPSTSNAAARERRTLELTAAQPGDVATARWATARHLRECGCGNVDDAVLVLSELVTNAVLHGGGADRIVVSCDDDSIRIAVHDRAAAHPERRHVEQPVGGRGLNIVDHLSRAWGMTPADDGKDVWAELPVSERARP